MQFSNLKYCYDDEKTNAEFGILGNVDNKYFALIAGGNNNRYYAEIMRQVEAGTLIIAEAD